MKKGFTEAQCNLLYQAEMWKEERVQVLKERAELRAENERLRKALSDVADVILKIDWTQVALNHAEPCCHVDDSGKLCGRANRWAGHQSQHKFISLYIYTRAALEQKP